MDARNCFARDKVIGITLEEFNKAHRVYCVTLSPDMEVDGIAQRRHTRGISVEIELG